MAGVVLAWRVEHGGCRNDNCHRAMQDLVDDALTDPGAFVGLPMERPLAAEEHGKIYQQLLVFGLVDQYGANGVDDLTTGGVRAGLVDDSDHGLPTSFLICKLSTTFQVADEVVVVFRIQVAVAVEDDGDARVPCAYRDLLWICACGNPQRDGGVTQVVNPERLESGCGHCGMPGSPTEEARTDRISVRRPKHEAIRRRAIAR